jgi:hypothetical protein
MYCVTLYNNMKRKYKEVKSLEKYNVRKEFVDWCIDSYKPGHTEIIILEGSGIKTVKLMIKEFEEEKKLFDCADVTIVENNWHTFCSHASSLKKIPNGTKIKLVYGDVFEYLATLAPTAKSSERATEQGKLIWLDLMCMGSTISQQNLTNVSQVLKNFPCDFIFITLCRRGYSLRKATEENDRFKDALTINGSLRKFGLYLNWPYKRGARNSLMVLLIFKNDPPLEPLYRPHYIIEKKANLYRIKWYGQNIKNNESMTWLPRSHEAVGMLLKKRHLAH